MTQQPPHWLSNLPGEWKNPFTSAKIVGDNIPVADYLRQAEGVKRGHPEYVMSRGALCEFDLCPRRWLLGYQDEGSKSTDWGDLIDALLLDPNKSRIAVCPETYPSAKGEQKPWIRSANYCKEWEAERVKAGFLVCKKSEFDDAEKAVGRLLDDSQIKSLVNASLRQVMCVAEYRDDETSVVVPLRILIDLAPNWPALNIPFAKCLADLKTCNSARPYTWMTSVFEHNYHVQAALYLDIFNAASGQSRTEFRHILSESCPPFEPAKRSLSDEFLSLGRAKYMRALKRYCQCLKTGEWPSYESRLEVNGWQVTEPAAWMILGE